MRTGLIIFLLVLYSFCRAAHRDSLQSRLKQNLPDTERVNTLNLLCYEVYLSSLDSALPYAQEALALAKEADFYKGMVTSYLYLSYLRHGTGMHEPAFAYADSAISLADAHKLEHMKVKLYNQLGNMHGDLGDISKSLDFYIKASKIGEKYKDKRTLVGAYANIGICFISNKQYAKSKEYLRKAMALSAEMREYKNHGNVLNNLGAVYIEENNPDSAIYYFKLAEFYHSKINFKRGLGFSQYYLGYLHNRKGLLTDAIGYYEKAGQIFAESGNTAELPNIYNCIAEVYVNMKQPGKALPYALRALDGGRKEQSASSIKDAYKILKEVHGLKGEYRAALDYYTRYVELKDSLFDSESTAQMAEMQTRYETVKKEDENKLLQAKNESNARTIRQQRYFGAAVAVICVLLVAFAVVIVRSNKQKQKVNLELERKNTLIETQKTMVEQKQKEILDSIYYARRIQRSLLASDQYIARNLKRLKK